MNDCHWWNGGHDWSKWSEPGIPLERIWDHAVQHRHCARCNRYQYRFVPCKEASA